MNVRFIIGLFVFGIFLFQGCSGLKPYPRQEVNNISISTKVDSGSFFSSVNTEVDIYALDDKCQRNYEGTLKLDKSSIISGITTDQEALLSFIFSNSSFLGNSNSSISFPIYLKTREGHRYDFIVSYKDNIYNVEVFEISQKTKKRRELETEKREECQSL